MMTERRNWQPNLALLLALGGAALLLIAFLWDRQPPTETIPYNQLAERIADGEITAVTVTDRRVLRAEATDGTRYIAYAETPTNVMAELEARGIDLTGISFTEQDGRGAFDIVFQLAVALGPVIVAVVMFAGAVALLLRWSNTPDE